MPPIRVICNNTLNLALAEAKRCWSTIRTGNLSGKLQDAKQTFLHADAYMQGLAEVLSPEGQDVSGLEKN